MDSDTDSDSTTDSDSATDSNSATDSDSATDWDSATDLDSYTQQRTTRGNEELDVDENFVDLLRVMLLWDPTDRPTAADLLKHHWFATSSSLAGEL